jgi:hypothetical protein
MTDIKPVTKWTVVRPDGEILVDRIVSSRQAALRGISDNAKQWRSLEAEGWRIVQVRIEVVEPVKQSSAA